MASYIRNGNRDHTPLSYRYSYSVLFQTMRRALGTHKVNKLQQFPMCNVFRWQFSQWKWCWFETGCVTSCHRLSTLRVNRGAQKKYLLNIFKIKSNSIRLHRGQCMQYQILFLDMTENVWTQLKMPVKYEHLTSLLKHHISYTSHV